MLKSRMTNPAAIVPGAIQALQAVAKVTEKALPAKTLELIHLRASQINGCAVCIDMHSRFSKAKGESDERLLLVSAWREAPNFTDAERAALALTESVTRLADRSDPVPDDVWNEAARHYDEPALGAIIIAIATINMWNRINVSTRQIAGAWMDSPEAKKWLETATK